MTRIISFVSILTLMLLNSTTVLAAEKKSQPAQQVAPASQLKVIQPSSNAGKTPGKTEKSSTTNTIAKIEEETENTDLDSAEESNEEDGAEPSELKPDAKDRTMNAAGRSPKDGLPAVNANIKEEFSKQAKPVAQEKTAVNAPAEKMEQAAKNSKTNVSQNQSSAALNASGSDSNTQVADSSNDLTVIEFVLATDVNGREPQKVVDSFDTNQERGFAYARLNPKQTSKVTFVWYRNNVEYTRKTLPVMAAQQWRTFSSVKLRPGQWKVELISESNQVLAEKTFTLE